MMFSIDLYQKAWKMATEGHKYQVYSGAEQGFDVPYIYHLSAVASEVLWGLTQVPGYNWNLALICAILHDSLEDTYLPYHIIYNEFGKEVAEGVGALTKNNTITSGNDKVLDTLKRIKEQPVEIAMVKLADRICNLSQPPFFWGNNKRKE